MGDTPVYQPTKLCAVCKGKCCRFVACHYSPRDFTDLTFSGLKKEIKKGRISIDWWVGDQDEYYLRARHVGEPIVCGSWGGTCVNLTETGCSLSWDERPLGGKALKPADTIDGTCTSSYTKEDCKEEWKAYADTLSQLVRYFRRAEYE